MCVYEPFMHGPFHAELSIAFIAFVAVMGWLTGFSCAASHAPREREQDVLFVLGLRCSGPVWESHFRSAMRWAKRRKNRPVVEMVLRGELVASMDGDGWIYVERCEEKGRPSCALTAEDLAMIERRELRP